MEGSSGIGHGHVMWGWHKNRTYIMCVEERGNVHTSPKIAFVKNNRHSRKAGEYTVKKQNCKDEISLKKKKKT